MAQCSKAALRACVDLRRPQDPLVLLIIEHGVQGVPANPPADTARCAARWLLAGLSWAQAAMFGLLFVGATCPIPPSSFQQVDPTHWVSLAARSARPGPAAPALRPAPPVSCAAPSGASRPLAPPAAALPSPPPPGAGRVRRGAPRLLGTSGRGALPHGAPRRRRGARRWHQPIQRLPNSCYFVPHCPHRALGAVGWRPIFVFCDLMRFQLRRIRKKNCLLGVALYKQQHNEGLDTCRPSALRRSKPPRASPLGA